MESGTKPHPTNIPQPKQTHLWFNQTTEPTCRHAEQHCINVDAGFLTATSSPAAEVKCPQMPGATTAFYLPDIIFLSAPCTELSVQHPGSLHPNTANSGQQIFSTDTP